MEVIGMEVIDAGKKFARIIVVFKDEQGRIAQYSVPYGKLKFVSLLNKPPVA